MPESLIFLTENSPGVSNDRFGIILYAGDFLRFRRLVFHAQDDFPLQRCHGSDNPVSDMFNPNRSLDFGFKIAIIAEPVSM